MYQDPTMAQVVFMQIYRWLIHRAFAKMRSQKWGSQDARMIEGGRKKTM